MNKYNEDSDGSLQSWISWFCSLAGHEFYLEVPEDFIEDDFNLTGLSSVVPYYQEAMDTILDIEPEEQDEKKPWLDPTMIERYAILLYGLIHQRYIITRHGLRIMAQRYTHEQFGVCPRVYCYKCPVLPCGRYDEIGKESVRLYCPSCLDIYSPPTSLLQAIDGAHFGTTFPHLLLETYPELMPKVKPYVYQPRIFGFRVHESAKSGPQMQWLRMRSEEFVEFDEEEKEEDDKPIPPLQAVDNNVNGSAEPKESNSFNSLFRRFF
ncbi:casein kinase II, regulatory subunit [Sporodiniella umbellata]|nr:casein kinase II, regulatory subunit [Sporodiniella umbellata]